jgi:hypothetical protein
MNNLAQIIVIAAWIAVPVSIWIIVYFSIRIFTSWHIKKHLGDMPSADEIHEMYAEINKQNQSGGVIDSRRQYDLERREKHSPTDKP